MSRSYTNFLFWLGLIITASVILYHTSDHVRALDQKLRSINAQISAEQESIHVLRAEWVYLANPGRVEAEAQRHLGLQPTAPNRVLALRNIASLLPVRDGVEPAQPSAQVADAVTVHDVDAPSAPAPALSISAAHAKHDGIVATLKGGEHINDHMVMQHGATTTSPDRIGALIGTLGMNQ